MTLKMLQKKWQKHEILRKNIRQVKILTSRNSSKTF